MGSNNYENHLLTGLKRHWNVENDLLTRLAPEQDQPIPIQKWARNGTRVPNIENSPNRKYMYEPGPWAEF